MARFDAHGHYIEDSDQPAATEAAPHNALQAQPHHKQATSPPRRPSTSALPPAPSLNSFLSPTRSSSTCPSSFSAWLSPPSSLLSSLIRNPHEAALLQSLASDASTLDSLLHSLIRTVVQGERLYHATLHLPHHCHPSHPTGAASTHPGLHEGGGSGESASDASSSSSSSSSSPPSPPRPTLNHPIPASAVAPPTSPVAAATVAPAPPPPSVASASPLAPLFACEFEGVHRPSFFPELRAAFASQVSSMASAFQQLTVLLLSLHERLTSLSSFHHLNERMAEELQLEGCNAIADAKRTVATVEHSLISRLTHLLAAALTPNEGEEEEQQSRDGGDEKAEAVELAGGAAASVSTALASCAAAVPTSPVVSSSASASTSSTSSSSSLSPSTHLDVILGVRSGGAGLTGKKRRGSAEAEEMRGLGAEVDRGQHQPPDDTPADQSSTQGTVKRRREEFKASEGEARPASDAARATSTASSSLQPPSPMVLVPSSPFPLGLDANPPPLPQSSRTLFSTDDELALAIREEQQPIDPPSTPRHATWIAGGMDDAVRHCEDVVGSSDLSSPSSSPPLFPSSSSSTPPPSPLRPPPQPTSSSRAAFSSQPSSAPAPALAGAAVRRSRSLALSAGDGGDGRGLMAMSDVAVMAVASAMAAVEVGGGESEVDGSTVEGSGGRSRRVEGEEEETTMVADGGESAAVLIVRCSQAARRLAAGPPPRVREPLSPS